MSANLSADDYIDYLYDDKEDYFSNVDYTMPDNFAYLDRLVAERLHRSPVDDLASLFVVADEADWLAFMGQSLMAVAFVVVSAAAFAKFPGHAEGQLWPVYVPEHYGPRCSQHLFDPYSFVHFGHGIWSYSLFSLFDDDSSPTRKTKKSALGLVATLFAALAAEVVENSPFTIDLFRQNSGTSGVYRGDSTVNVIGDLIACSMGYNFARYFTLAAFPAFPWICFLLTEFLLALFIRDNLFLILLQLIYPIEAVKAWQSESFMTEVRVGSDDEEWNEFEAGYWSTKFTSKYLKKDEL